jgi:type IV secretory pathway TraG/TraD family ATPase VirD4
MIVGTFIVRAAAVCSVMAMSLPLARAADINGIWAQHRDTCQKLYVKRGGSVSFATDSDLHGSGLIIEGNTIRGKMGRCSVKTRKDEGDLVNITAACATDISVETVEFTLKVISESRIARVFPHLPELNTEYERCSI